VSGSFCVHPAVMRSKPRAQMQRNDLEDVCI